MIFSVARVKMYGVIEMELRGANQARIPDEICVEIKNLHAAGYTCQRLAKIFVADINVIQSIIGK